MTYLLLSLPFVGVGLVAFLLGLVVARRRGGERAYVASWAVTTALLIVLTAVFDNVMIAAGFFEYADSGISGIRFVLMPVEDFLYPLAGSLLIAGVWELLGSERDARRRSDA
jgi:lycopene cyclase domain-containing protein